MVGLAFLFSPFGTAQSSKQSGNWTDASTWLSGLLPTTFDNVTINLGHIITIPSGQIAGAGILNDKGTLRNFGTLNMGKISPTDLYSQTLHYHIRGGLRGLNLDANNNLTNALFSMKLSFEDDGTYFDGNIRSQTWISSIDNLSRTFTYRYDGSSRIKAGVYSGGKTGENYTLNNVTYDNNGNIKNLIRSGLKANNSFGIIDNLSYTYNANSNKILKVDDLSNETASFTDMAGNDYTYSADGSLMSDANKGITLIENNYLKLPRRIIKNGVTILYQYSASGKKLKETIGTQVTDYVGNVIYKNGVLYQISHDEGRVVDGIYEYNIKDHLGNLRVAFRDNNGVAEITQSNAYGIFGEDLTSLTYIKPAWKEDKFKFTGKEELTETGYIDFGARLYDKLVPHFTTIDPLAETSRRFSPYVYALNNPIRFIDPDGMEAEPPEGFEYSDGYQNHNSRDNTGAVSFEGAYLNAGGGGSNDGGDKPKVESKKSLQTAEQAKNRNTTNGLRPGGDGIEADYTLDGAYIGGKIFNPVVGFFGKLWGKAFGKANLVIETGLNLTDDFIESAIKPWGEQGLTNVGRALQKHAGREGSVFENIKFSHKTANKDGLNILNDILNSSSKIVEPAERGGFEIYDTITKKGVAVSREGLFNGFREFKK